MTQETRFIIVYFQRPDGRWGRRQVPLPAWKESSPLPDDPSPQSPRPPAPLYLLDRLPPDYDLLFSRRLSGEVYCVFIPKDEGPRYGGSGDSLTCALAAALADLLETTLDDSLDSHNLLGDIETACVESPPRPGGEGLGVSADNLDLAHLMRRLGELKHHVHVRYDPERAENYFTVIVDDRRLCDTDDPAIALLRYWRDYGNPDEQRETYAALVGEQKK